MFEIGYWLPYVILVAGTVLGAQARPDASVLRRGISLLGIALVIIGFIASFYGPYEFFRGYLGVLAASVFVLGIDSLLFLSLAKFLEQIGVAYKIR